MIPFEDKPARERDGELREAEYDQDGVTNPLQSSNLSKQELDLLRATAIWPVRIGCMDLRGPGSDSPGMDQRRIHPLDVIRLTHEEYDWSNTEVQVISVVQLRDRTAVCLCRRYNKGMFDATLSLPGIQKRPAARWPVSDIPLDLTGLRARDRLDIRHDSIRNWTDVLWDPKVVAGTEVEYQLISERKFTPSGRAVVSGVDPTLTLIQAIEAESGRAVVRGGGNPTTTQFQSLSC